MTKKKKGSGEASLGDQPVTSHPPSTGGNARNGSSPSLPVPNSPKPKVAEPTTSALIICRNKYALTQSELYRELKHCVDLFAGTGVTSHPSMAHGYNSLRRS
jgi:hypothetical protein